MDEYPIKDMISIGKYVLGIEGLRVAGPTDLQAFLFTYYFIHPKYYLT